MMKNSLVALRDGLLSAVYRRLLKPLAFQFDPETVHHQFIRFGHRLGRYAVTRQLTRLAFGYTHPILKTRLGSITLSSPVGLSAGFDKEGELVSILPSLGFGFTEIGSVTGTPGPGNPRPRLWRLPKSRGLAVNLGLNSSGAIAIAGRLRAEEMRFPWAVSIAKANLPEFDSVEAGIADYVRAAKALDGIGAWRVINISCPNTTGGEPFVRPDNLERLLRALDPWLQNYPVYIKLPADEPLDVIEQIVDVALRHHITGLTCTNLSRDRSNPAIHDHHIPPKGGLSGKIVEQRSNDVLRYVYQRAGQRLLLIGVGGIFSAEDAYRKIRLGASAVQLITGMIYRGPGIVSEINRGLVALLQRDGFRSVSEAVGIDARVG